MVDKDAKVEQVEQAEQKHEEPKAEKKADNGLASALQAELEALTAETNPADKKPVEKAKEDSALTDIDKMRLELRQEIEDELKKSTQARFDELTAKIKERDERLTEFEKRQRDPQTDPIKELVKVRDDLLLKKKQVKKAITQAYIDGDPEKADALIEKETEVDLMLLRLDKEYDRIQATAKEQESKMVAVAKQQEWDRSLQKAMKRFPELADGNGNLNMKSDLFTKAAELMMNGARKPQHHTFLNALNPDYDHADGPYTAIIDAYMDIHTGKETEKVQKVQKENQQLKAKEQLLSDTRVQGDVDRTAKKRKELIDAVVEHGMNANEGLEFLRMENKRLGWTP